MRWQFYSKSVHSAHNSAIYANTHQTDECRANTFLMLFVLSERWWSCSTLICPMFNVGVGGDRLKRNDTLKDEKEMPFFTRQRFMDLNICWMCSRFDQKRKKKREYWYKRIPCRRMKLFTRHFGRIHLLDRSCACGAIERNCVDRTHANRSMRMIAPLWHNQNAPSKPSSNKTQESRNY